MGLATAATGCLEDINPQREVRDYGSFGTELYNILYVNSEHSVEHSSPQFLQTFTSHREEFVAAVDATAIPEDLDELNQVFIRIVPLYENMLYPATLRKVTAVIDEVRHDRKAVEAMAWLTISPSVIQNPEDANPVATILEYDDLAGITDELIGLLIRNSTAERNATNQFLKELSITAASLEDDSDENSVVRSAIQKLVTPHDIYAPSMSYAPQIVVALDPFGAPRVRPEMASVMNMPRNDMGYYRCSSGALLAPYDMTGSCDGFSMADSGLLYHGNPVFETFDLQKTALAYLLREGDALLAETTLDQALRATKSMLGAPVKHEDEDGSYMGYSSNTGIAKLSGALVTTLDHDSVGPNFEAIIQVLQNHPDTVARLVHDVEVILDIVDETPSHFSTDNDLVDRLLPELLELAQEPGFFEDLFMALDEPIAAEIAPIFSELAQRRASFIDVAKDSAYEACFQACDAEFDVGTFDRMRCIQACPRDQILGTAKANHNAPESLDNRSLFQRTIHLMWETSATPYDVRAQKLTVGANCDHDTGLNASGGSCDYTSVAQAIGTLLEFDNLAEAYLLTITGDLHLIDHLSPKFSDLGVLIGDDGTTVATLLTHLTANFFDLKLSVDPTTAEVTRLFNRSVIATQSDSYRLALNVATCRSGYTCLESNADVLFALEATGLVDALYPVVKVFNDHGKTDVLARITAMLFEYYPSGDIEYKDASGNVYPYAHEDSWGGTVPYAPSNFRSVEPILIRALAETNIVGDFGDFGDALLDVQLKDGTKLAARFEKFVTYLLTPQKDLKDITGAEFVKNPQGIIVAPLSPAYLYIDAIRDIADFLDEHPDAKTQFEDAAEGFADITVRTVSDGHGGYVFEKPAGIQVIADLVSVLLEVFEARTADGTRSKWIQEDALPGVRDFFEGRLLYAFFQLFEELDGRPAGLERFRKFVLHIMESGSETPRNITGGAYMLMSWLLQDHHFKALARVFASPLDPDRVWPEGPFSELSFVLTLLTNVDAFNECDPQQTFNHVFYRLLETKTHKRSNLQRMLDTGYDLFRVNPGDTAQRTVDDMQVFLDFAHSVFADDDRGVERIFGLIDFTIWGNDRRPADWKPEDASWQIQFK